MNIDFARRHLTRLSMRSTAAFTGHFGRASNFRASGARRLTRRYSVRFIDCARCRCMAPAGALQPDLAPNIRRRLQPFFTDDSNRLLSPTRAASSCLLPVTDHRTLPDLGGVTMRLRRERARRPVTLPLTVNCRCHRLKHAWSAEVAAMINP